ncbi:hypothetical protein [Lentilactobacillus hilgardii]|uniref:Uncharacterized protein n=1 Tax=Lentilactobacillus hilgardii (strain ATCC 8290 / DSM 20176 / CCUG 30140 / JCM 1155 / KCTC 3500 / NBRC 15886 / NCIMB 8040 / NRRL B-1843 / 9) TaxID=1423757 RepID=C0XGT2_LENH9|nr:hypothetical protein [Lentilactobacillus hilgardii]EEI19560.1 hypothetical protein HMPREF0497_1631 [Lentilactobacillus buchneri ATCC 11577]EEI25403.1 hypothetical protein HMPREF0519_0443 [Lentilactobacillus hilgardii DSM 20176 = ATCC 8290]KRK56853.1 hypothetical protein FD42_GL002588 [Lentilactobacillus hilgardii DSM 20176 = ATCC 8290]MCP9333454.1 hypothetical protein [Lentilactobacillus hilgardii]MCP9349989.1 hypothetical protein [Lentilactobacillus hilgardii]
MIKLESEDGKNYLVFDGETEGVTLSLKVALDDATIVNTVKTLASGTSLAKGLFKLAMDKVTNTNFKAHSDSTTAVKDVPQSAVSQNIAK